MTSPALTPNGFVSALMGRRPRSLAQDIDATKARLTATLATHDTRDMPEDVWADLADAHHYLTAAGAYLHRSQAAQVVIDDA